MAIIKKKQMKELSAADAKKRLAELRLDLAKDRAQIAVGGSPPNPGKTREKRRTIAKLLTLISTKKKEVEKTA
jgi:large subunit ribosomal protein L29